MADKNAATEKHVVVDGSNIATEGRSLPSLRQLDEAVRAFIDEHPHDRVTVVVDATFGHRIEASEKDAFEEAVLAGELVSPPAGAIGRGDAFVLQIADKANATILSNDSFQEFHGQYDWLFDEGRLIGGKPVQGVGWIFMMRTPVRGPMSRRATRSAKKRAPRAPAASKKAATTAPATKAAGSGPSSPRKRGGSRRSKAEPTPPAETTPQTVDGDTGSGRGGNRRKRRSGGGGKPTEPVNEPLPFIEFIADHPLGSTVTGTVESFSSHGAYVLVNSARCYIPLKAMAEPAPTRARDVLTIGEERDFVVTAIDTPRRGIDVALPGFAEIQEPPDTDETEPSTAEDAAEGIMSRAKAPAEARRASTAATRQSGATTEAGTALTAEEVPEVAQAKKATKKKTAAKKATAKKTSAAKSTAKKATSAARKSTAKKAPARKAAAKKSAAKRAPAKKTAAKKSAAKKSTAKKSAAKRSPAKKSAAKKTAAKKTTARKTTAKRTAKKAAKKR